MLTLSISFELNLDALLSHDGWPQWLENGMGYLQEISAEEKWLSLLVSFVKLERQLGPSEAVGCQLL